MPVDPGISGGSAQPSYSYMLDTICEPQERNEVLYQWKDDPHLLSRNEFIGNLYNEFQREKSLEAFVRTMIANYISGGDLFLQWVHVFL